MNRILALAGAILLTGVVTAGALLGITSDYQKVHAVGTNLLANPSMEESTNGAPTAWGKDNWGTNTPTYAYNTSGHTGSRSLTVALSGYASGDAKWFPTSVAVSPNTSYTFSDWYQSTAANSVDAVITLTTGKTSYKWLGDLAASSAWKEAKFSFKTPANAKSITFYHYLQTNGSLTTDDYSLVSDTTTTPTPPTIQLTGPASGTTISGIQTISATASDAQGIKSVQFKLDGANLGTADTTAPYTASWDTKAVANSSHMLAAVATNTANLTTTSASVTVTVQNITPTPPTVQITAPAAGATVSGPQTVTATAASNVAVTSVQFKLDGANLGAAVTTAPYGVNWDTTAVANGTHTLTAVATNSAAQSTTSAAVTVTVNNVTTPPVIPPTTGANLIANPSVETVASSAPANWHGDGWGTNTRSLTYENTGRTGSHSVKTTITAYTNGDAKWYFDEVSVTAGKTYQYTNWYQSSVDSEIDAQVTMTDGTVQYYYLGQAPASTAWAKATGQFTTPVGAKSLTIFQVLAKKGYIISDDFSLAEYTPQGFNRALVSLTFDDGWLSQYTNALPILDKYGMNATFYLLTEPTLGGYSDYMTVAQMQALKDHGNELDSHTVSHPHLPALTITQVDSELANAQSQLRAWLGAGVADDFATPFGEYNSSVLTEIKKYYRSHRSVEEGFNSKDNFDIYDIKVQNILYTTTAAQVQAWVEQAQRDHTWLVLVYHEVATAVEDPTYSISPADLDAQLAAIKAKGIAVKTLGAALDEIAAQL
jgi:peptidoglycan/xylan/chitin deacetylase (PgdA/CDA1 family)